MKVFRKKYTAQKISRVSALAFLLLYSLSFLRIDFLHKAIHTHEEHEELHSEAFEQDACHRQIYHQEKKAGCEHETHFSETHTDCELCNHHVADAHVVLPAVYSFTEAPAVSHHVPAVFVLFSDFHFCFHSRGPPSIA